MKNKSANVILRVAHVDAHFIFLIGYCIACIHEAEQQMWFDVILCLYVKFSTSALNVSACFTFTFFV